MRISFIVPAFNEAATPRAAGHALALLGLAAVVIGLTVDRSNWISGYLQDEEARTGASGTIGLGKDYVVNVWIPTRALRAGLDPYDPDEEVVQRRYGAPWSSAPYTPSLLLALLPLSALSVPHAVEAMHALNMLLVWLALLVLIPPRSWRACVLVALLGLATFIGWAGESALLFGQPIGFFVLGAALLSRAVLQQHEFGLGAIVGLTLLMTKAQYALPIVVALAVLRKWRVLGISTAITVVASVPFGLLFVRAAGGIGEAVSTLRRSALWTNETFPLNRSDLVSLLTGNDAASVGTAGALVQLVGLGALVGLMAYRYRPTAPADTAAVAAALVAVDLVAIYHQWYDLAVLVVPAAVLLIPDDLRGTWRRLPLLAALTTLFLVVNVATNTANRARLDDASVAGLDFFRSFDLYWPPVISLAILVGALAGLIERRAPLRVASDRGSAG